MIGSIDKENGYIDYSEEVVANIVGLSTMECYGVVGMASKSSRSGSHRSNKNCCIQKNETKCDKENIYRRRIDRMYLLEKKD